MPIPTCTACSSTFLRTRYTVADGAVTLTINCFLHSTEISQSIHGAIQEYAGIERPKWLDLR
jgi:transposase-like protein